jgi:SAM-dependent methyltransferase
MMFPIRLGSDAEFTALRDALLALDYTEPTICARFGVDRLPELRVETIADHSPDTSDAIFILTRLFMGCVDLPSDARPLLPIRDLEALGLLRIADEKLVATVMLYPLRGLYIVSDLPEPTFEDVVYPANVPNSDLCLDYLPTGPCDAFLDLCSGTGIAALTAARNGARHSWAFDITARAAHFAEFNRRLNAIPNMTPAQGDLYEPAGEQTFDRILVHPPYLPVFRPHFVFDSGGQDGEQIVRRIIEGLPRYLRPGGQFVALTMGTDREQPFERRLRDWLGVSSVEFDVGFFVRKTVMPRDYSADAVLKHKGSAEDIAGWRELFAKWGVRQMPYGFVYIQRRETDRPVFTVRRNAGPKTGRAECEWLMEWSRRASDVNSILNMKLHARENVSLRVEHRLNDGEWTPESYRLESSFPFVESMQTEPLAAHLVTMADGSRTTRELFEHLKSEEQLPATFDPVEFVRVVSKLISAGFLETNNSSSAFGPESTR